MTNLTVNQKAFIEMMKRSLESEEDGFSLLAKRPDAQKFFDALDEAGFFAPDKNSAPIPGRDGTSVSIPYWRALDYLETVARHAGETMDDTLAARIVRIFVSVSTAARDDEGRRNNFHTWRKFAEISALLPRSSITAELVGVIPIWLSSDFDRDMVGEAIGIKLIPEFLASDQTDHHVLALKLLRQVTKIRWVKRERFGESESEPETVVESYWVREILAKNLSTFAMKVGQQTADLFRQHVNEVFGEGSRFEASWLFRPAIEDHDQNFDWHGAENMAVDGLRDALLIWSEAAPPEAVEYVKSLFDSQIEIEQRIAVHLVDQKFGLFRGRLSEFLDERLLKIGLLHETYHFLRNRFVGLSATEKTTIVELIAAYSVDNESEDEKRGIDRAKHTWLSAIQGRGSDDADKLFADVARNTGPLSDHPDFISYLESSSGPGPTPYSKAELIKYLLDDQLVARLNDFVPTGHWRSPTKRALVDTLQYAIEERPGDFLGYRMAMLRADRLYQYAFLSAYMRLWNADTTERASLDWKTAWPLLMEWMLELVKPQAFWDEETLEDKDLTPTRDWIPPVIAEFLRAGTRADDHAFSPELLPKARELIVLLLAHTKSETMRDQSDPVHYAINSPRGKAVEALVNYALRTARLADNTSGAHTEVWENDIKPLFEMELRRIEDGNQEFVILFGQYAPQIQYLSSEWLARKFAHVFSQEHEPRLTLALSGLAFASATHSIYKLLRDASILDAGLAIDQLPGKVRERLVERIALACVWGIESLDGERVAAMFEVARIQDVEVIARFFWGLSGQELTPDQIDLMREFWRRATRWAQSVDPSPMQLFSSLSRMICYFEEIVGDDEELVVALASHAGSNFDGWSFMKELHRLADRNPEVVAAALARYVEATHPSHDFRSLLLSTTEKVVAAGHTTEAIRIAAELKRLPGFRDLYKRIR